MCIPCLRQPQIQGGFPEARLLSTRGQDPEPGLTALSLPLLCHFMESGQVGLEVLSLCFNFSLFLTSVSHRRNLDMSVTLLLYQALKHFQFQGLL